MKRPLKIVLLIFCSLIIFRGQLFRACFTYVALEQVKLPKRSSDFQSLSQKTDIASRDTTIEKQLTQALRYTSSHLYFTTGPNASDPVQLLHTQNANCIGYGNFFQHRLEYQLKLAGIAKNYDLQQWRGKLYCLGWDIHKLFKSPFWKDHDFNIIIDKNSGRKIAIDATLFDYFRIRTVRLQ